MPTTLQVLPPLVGLLLVLGLVTRRSPASWPFFPYLSALFFFALALLDDSPRVLLQTAGVLTFVIPALFFARHRPLPALCITLGTLFALDLIEPNHGASRTRSEVLIGFSYLLFRAHDAIVVSHGAGDAPPLSLKSFLLQVFAFPARTAGPILLQKQFHVRARPFSMRIAHYRRGVFFLFLGLAKILVLLPAFQFHFETGAAFPPIASFDALLKFIPTLFTAGAYLYVRLYLDFSAYTDIAVGAAALLGLRIRHNFRRPFLAQSLADFWRRWHITLSAWVFKHVYLPLGGNRRGGRRTALNLILAMLLIGLWHGLSRNFALWGLLHGLMLTLERFALEPALERFGVSENRLVRAARLVFTQSFVALSWVVFFAR